MAKPTSDTEEALIRAGTEIIRESGFAGLSLRRVAARAGANLGMFPYLFGSKEAFVRKVAQRIYDDFFSGFSLATSRQDRPVENLRRGLVQLGRFVRDNRRLALALASDVILRQDREARKFLGRNVPRHGLILLRLVRAAQRDGSIGRLPLPVVAGHLMGSIAGPAMFIGAVEASGVSLPARLALPFIRASVLTDEAIRFRVNLALASLTPKAIREARP